MSESEYEESNGIRRIYRGYNDTEVAELWVNLECPYCGNKQQELGLDDCSTTYKVECNECDEEFEMHFDVD